MTILIDINKIKINMKDNIFDKYIGMQKGQVFTFERNDIETTAVVVDLINTFEEKVPRIINTKTTYLCYGQNRLFYYTICEEQTKSLNEEGIKQGFNEDFALDNTPNEYIIITKEYSEICGEIIVEYCIIPEFDNLINNYINEKDKFE